MSLGTQVWLGALSALVLLLFWWAIMDDARLKRLERKS